MRTILTLLTACALLSGCGSARRPGALDVVASTNVYGDIARQIGGAHVEVTSVLTDPNADPHLFEPGTRNGLAIAQAALVIQNGLGYDTFMERLEAAAPSGTRRTVVVADALGARGSGVNPHLWYDVPRLGRVAAAIADGLVQADRAHRSAYRAGLRRFDASLAPLRAEVARIRAAAAGAPVAYTEPLPGYLIAAAGLRNLAPVGFTRAIADGSEPAPGPVSDLLHLLTGRRVRVLLYNSQAVSPITARMRSAAERAGIPVVAVTETLPAGATFQSWQLHQARALRTALTG